MLSTALRWLRKGSPSGTVTKRSDCCNRWDEFLAGRRLGWLGVEQNPPEATPTKPSASQLSILNTPFYNECPGESGPRVSGTCWRTSRSQSCTRRGDNAWSQNRCRSVGPSRTSKSGLSYSSRFTHCVSRDSTATGPRPSPAPGRKHPCA